MIFRILVEKKEPYNIEAQKLLSEIKRKLEIDSVNNLRIVTRYDIEDISEEVFEKAKYTVLAEPVSDEIIGDLPVNDKNNIVFAVGDLPGQYDQTADTCAQCLQILNGANGDSSRPLVKTAKIYILETDSAYDMIKDTAIIKNYVINKISSHEISLDEYQTLKPEHEIPYTVEIFKGFIDLNKDELEEFVKSYSLAMDSDDILFCQNYFKNSEKRDPTVTEIRMIDTYWSDHCRHTTFLTEITEVEIEDLSVQQAFKNYLELRGEVYGENKSKKSVSLMDLATIGAKYLKKQGKLSALDESEEVNACSVNIKVDINGKLEDYILMFKNETHNHPTEMEPFGGAATALGGAIRDVMAGRAYVYQGMRVTGSADPRKKISDTMKNKLPQFKITRTASDGFSSYGNQIGAATSGVFEIYHPNYAAKRMELGAIVGAVPKANVHRETPVPGDAIILLGGKTGRDGCGAATGSSKSQTSESLDKSGAEVQKGDAVLERRILRLFRNPKAAAMIKRCNDFGAGGVSVAIGELADSIFVDLSLVPVKYNGLDGTELAISESQERMAVVVDYENVDAFIREAELENLEAAKIAMVTDDSRLRMIWNGNQILSLERGFLNSNGAKKQTKIKVLRKDKEKLQNILNILYQKIKMPDNDIKQAYINLLSDINICSQKGLAEKFDSTAGAGTVIAPYGGQHRLTPAQFTAAKIPVLNGSTETASVMAHGFSPYVSEVSPYLGALYAVVESVTKLVAAGVNLSDIYLTFQEYFPGTKNSPERFGLPFEALLGALEAQINLELASIGGKDSMSGSYSYEDEQTGEKANIDVPPTLVSFAVGTANAEKIISNEFKRASSYVYLLKPLYKDDGSVNFEDLKNLCVYVNKLIGEKFILSSYAVGFGGIGEAVFKMCIGGGVGFSFNVNITQRELFSSFYGAFVVESSIPLPHGDLIGRTNNSSNISVNNIDLKLNDLTYKWLMPLEDVFPTDLNKINDDISVQIPALACYDRPSVQTNSIYNNNFAKPRVLIPVFPGSTGEYDMSKQFNDAGGLPDTFVFKNINPKSVNESIDILYNKISESQILAIPGGFSGGDGFIGSGKFIAAVLRNPKITEAVRDLLFIRGGLILGISNGFQALVKIGLLPYGDIKEPDLISEDEKMTIGLNRIGRHQSYISYTRVASVKSPWFNGVKIGDIHALPVSHGEGRICVNDDLLSRLIQNGQIAAQYCDINGNPTMHPYYNPGASKYAIESMFGLDGRVFGKMGHSERNGKNIIKNIPGNKSQMIFTSGIKYFK